MTITRAELAAMRAAEEDATKGPWEAQQPRPDEPWWNVSSGLHDVVDADGALKHNAAFIALSREFVPQALAALDEQARKLAAIGELLAEHGCDCDCEHRNDEHEDDCYPCLACSIESVMFKVSP